MDVLLTPDVVSYLGISSVSIHSANIMQPSVVFAFSKTHITFVSNEKPTTFSEPTYVKIRTRLNSFSIPIAFESLMQTTTKHWLFTFTYSPEKIAPPLHEQWTSLLDISELQQLRADIRISASKNNIDALHINQMENKIWIHGKQVSCSLQNISFSGARILCVENDLLEGDDKVVIEIHFTSPSEIASIRAVVLRTQIIMIAETACIDLAVRFFDPVDLVLRTRLAEYFQKHSEIH